MIDELQTILLSVSSHSISSSELERLVYFTRSIAETFLLHYRDRYQRLCEQSGVSFSDLATDCIAEVFRRDDIGKFVRLEQFLASLSASLETVAPIDIFFAYKSLVIEVTKARLARAFAEIDPEGARLSRNVKEAVEKEKNLLELTGTCRGYVLHPLGVDPFEPREPLHLEVVERELLHGTKADNIPDVLRATAKILLDQREYQQSIYLNDYVSALKRYFANLNTTELDTGESQLSEISEMDLLILKDRALKAVQKKIVTTYLGKISLEEGKALVGTLSSIIDEWISQKEITNSFATHAARAFSIAESEYRIRWRTKVEYLVKTARETFETYWLTDI